MDGQDAQKDAKEALAIFRDLQEAECPKLSEECSSDFLRFNLGNHRNVQISQCSRFPPLEVICNTWHTYDTN